MKNRGKTGVCALLLLLFFGTSSYGQLAKKEANTPLGQLQKLNQFYSYLDGAYVDTLDNGALVEVAITEMLAQLDPHSSYISAEEMVGVRESFDGSFSGIGIEFNTLKDTIIVVNVIAGGPSQSVGLLPSDRIVAVDGKRVIGTKQMEVPKLLRGPKGSIVELEVVRASSPTPLQFRITRDNIPINTVDAAYKIDPQTGYIRINRFANNTFAEFKKAFKELGEMDALVLDLRGNGGGLLDQAIELSNFFLPQGATIVATEGLRIPSERVTAPENGAFTKGKVIILTDESSASGSEIVAGAVQDWDRGLLIGRRTFGKGLVQRQFPLLDGSGVRLTVARYHTPTGRMIQRPFEKGNKAAYYKEFSERYGTVDSLRGDSTELFKTLRSGRIVYGGGGIYPDIYVALDTTAFTDYWADLIRKGVVSEYVIAYMDKNRSDMEKKFPTIAAFQSGFAADSTLLNGLTALASERGIIRNEEQLQRSEKEIKTQLKALIAQKLWGMNEYFIIENENNEIYLRALEALKNWKQESSGIVNF